MEIRIIDVKGYTLLYPLPYTIKYSWEPFPHDLYICTLVEVTDEAGDKGYSAAEFGPAYKSYLEGIVRTVLQSMEFTTPKDLERLISIGSWIYMRLGPVENAIWDLIARKKGKPLYRLLGGARNKVKVYASMGRIIDVDEASSMIEKYIELGIELVKIRLRRPLIDDDIAFAKALSKRFRGDILFAADANQAWSVTPPFWNKEDAKKVGDKLYELEFEWLEEPLYMGDIQGYRWLREHVDIPIAGGELEHRYEVYKYMVEMDAIDILQSDAVYGDGIVFSQRIAELAWRKNLRYMPHAWDPGLGWLFNLHLSAAYPSSKIRYLEFPFDPIDWPKHMFFMMENHIEINNGYVEIPEDEGTGFNLNMEAVKKYSI